MKKPGYKPFYSVTNKDIYDKLITIEKKLNKLDAVTMWHSWAIGILGALLIGMSLRP